MQLDTVPIYILFIQIGNMSYMRGKIYQYQFCAGGIFQQIWFIIILISVHISVKVPAIRVTDLCIAALLRNLFFEKKKEEKMYKVCNLGSICDHVLCLNFTPDSRH